MELESVTTQQSETSDQQVIEVKLRNTEGGKGGTTETSIAIPVRPIPILLSFSGRYRPVGPSDAPPLSPNFEDFDDANLSPAPGGPLPGPTPPGPFPGPTPGPFPGPINPAPTPIPFPQPQPQPIPQPFPPLFPRTREVMRLDIDGSFPQNTISGNLRRFLGSSVHWIASITRVTRRRWSGNIWYKNGALAFPYTNVLVELLSSSFFTDRRVRVTFSATGVANRVVEYTRTSSKFHDVEFEFDNTAGSNVVTQINTHDHPNRPGDLPNETLTLNRVFERAGFAVTTSPNTNVVGAPPGGSWSDTELHDAMQVNWSRFSNSARWAMWVLFGERHERGHGLGGIMFDDIGPNHRQGTALFTNSFISDPPANEPAATRNAWIRRNVFWTAAHEMGHAFNLAHSWQKTLGVPVLPDGNPWIPLTDDSEARSFMNYPDRVSGRQAAFFSNFRFRFIDPELLFMRHAPERFVQMGNADWFDDHGFQGANVAAEPSFALTVRPHLTNEEKKKLEHPDHAGNVGLDFLEPLTLELKLTNVSGEDRLTDGDHVDLSHVVLIVKKEGGKARRYMPFAHECHHHKASVLRTGESRYEIAFIGADRTGWLIAEPGFYTVQAAMSVGGEDVISNTIRVRVRPPRGYEEEHFAQDFFQGDVGRTLNFDGSNVLEAPMNTLRELVDQFPKSRAAIHARVALATIAGGGLKRYVLSGNKPKIETTKPRVEEARKLWDGALRSDADTAAESLGHIDYADYAERYAKWLHKHSDKKAATQFLNTAAETLKKRGIRPTAVEKLRSCLTASDE